MRAGACGMVTLVPWSSRTVSGNDAEPGEETAPDDDAADDDADDDVAADDGAEDAGDDGAPNAGGFEALDVGEVGDAAPPALQPAMAIATRRGSSARSERASRGPRAAPADGARVDAAAETTGGSGTGRAVRTGAFPFSRRYEHDRGSGDRTSDARPGLARSP